MSKILLTSLFAVSAALASPALAQDPPNTRVEPYVSVQGTYENFDREHIRNGIPNRPTSRIDGGMIEGTAGVNVPVGRRFFAGAEGNLAKGVTGKVDWQYGVAGRAGIRTNDGGLFYGKVGYQWMTFKPSAGALDKTYHGTTYGAGVEVPPSAGSRVRLRGEVSTFGNFHSIRPSVGAVIGF